MRKLLALVATLLTLSAVTGWAQEAPGGGGTVHQAASRPVNGTLQNAAVASGNGTALDVTGQSFVVFTINCASCSGGTAVNIEGSEDGTNYKDLPGSVSTPVTSSGFTIYQASAAGFTKVRARISSYSAGTVTVTAHAVPVGSFSATSVTFSGSIGTVNQGTSPWVDQISNAATTTEAATFATGASNLWEVGSLNYFYNGTTWQRARSGSQVAASSASVALASDQVGTAGTAASTVVSIQGIASMTPVQVQSNSVNIATAANQTNASAKTQIVDGSGNVISSTGNAFDVNIKSGGASGVAQGSTTSGQVGTLVQGAVTTSAPSYTNAQTSPLSLTTGGALRVDASAATINAAQSGNWTARLADSSGNGLTSNANGGSRALSVVVYDASGNPVTAFSGSGGTASNIGSSFPSSATAAGFNDGTNMQGARVINANSSGAFYVLGTNAVFRTAGTPVEAGTSSNPWSVVFPSAQSVNATLSAETTKVIGTINIAASQSVGVTQATASSLNATVVGTGTFAVQAAESGTWSVRAQDGAGTALLSAANALNSTGAGLLATQQVFQFDDVAPTSITENQFGNARMSANRNQYMTIRDAAGNERGVNVTSGNALVVDASASTQPVSGTVNAAESGTWTVQPGNTANTTAWLMKLSQTSTDNDVDANVTAVVPGTSATSLGKAFQGTPGTTDTGVAMIGVRKDTPADLAGTAGKYTTVEVDANGRLWTNPFPTSPSAATYLPVRFTLDGSTFPTADTQATQDGALGTITNVTGGMLFARGSAAAPTNVSASDDAVLPWALLNGSLVTNIAVGGTLITGTGSSLNVNCTGGCSSTSVADEASFTQGTSSIVPIAGLFKTSYTNLTSGQVGVAQMTTDGALFSNLHKIAGTAVVTGGLAGTLGIGGAVAHDAVGTGISPVLMGGYASQAAPSDVSADGDATRLWVLRNGSAVVNLAAGGTLITATSTSLNTNVTNTNLSVQSNSLNLVPAVAQASTTSGQSGALVQGAVTTAAPSYTTAQTSPLSLDTSGNLRVTGAVTVSSVSATGSSVPASADYTGLNAGGTLRGQTATSLSAGAVIAGHVDIQGLGGTLVGSGNPFYVSQVASVPLTTTMQNAATASGNGSTLSSTGMSTAVLTVNCSSCSGGTTVNFEGTQDGTNYTSLMAAPVGTVGGVPVTSTTASGFTYWRLNVDNLSAVRARISAYSAGTVTVTGTTSPMPTAPRNVEANLYLGGTAGVSAGVSGTLAVGGNQATNNNVSSNTNPVLIAGSDYGGTAKIQNWKVDSSGIGYVQFSSAQSVNATLQAGTALVGSVVPWAGGTLKSGVTSAMTGTTSTQVVAAVASNYLYISSCSVNNTHASVDTLVNLQDGSGGTTLWTFTAPHANGGESHSFPIPLKVPTSGNGLYAADVTTGASVIISCNGVASTVSY